MPRLCSLRFSVRTSLLIVTLLCAWLGWRSYAAHQVTQAIAGIRTLGGEVQPSTPQETFWAWLLGSQRVTSIYFLGPTTSDADIEAIGSHVSRLPELDTISLIDTAVSEAGSRRLRRQFPGIEVRSITTVLDAF